MKSRKHKPEPEALSLDEIHAEADINAAMAMHMVGEAFETLSQAARDLEMVAQERIRQADAARSSMRDAQETADLLRGLTT